MDGCGQEADRDVEHRALSIERHLLSVESKSPMKYNRFIKVFVLCLFVLLSQIPVVAQELQARININHSQVQGTDESIFENLQQTLEQFINERQWTPMQFQKNERIQCSFNITVSKYDRDNNRFTCSAMVQANRPVYNSAYTTTLIAYYAYLIIGLDLDSFAPLDGTEVLQQCMNLVNNAQDLGFSGWKAFDDSRNRFAIINDYLDESMKPLRQLQYDYYRNGLDEMANNADRGRTNISAALQEHLKAAHDNKPLSLLPQIWTDFKRDELANIYKGKGTQKEKEAIYELLFSINASQGNAWEQIKQ